MLCEDVDMIHLVQYMVLWRELVNKLINFRVP